ncbi:MAG TPA: helix-turn-helix domain-containing protein [Anaerolineaceae bacterium]|nr:helix-turn-helix domain-containing protein [Anaerolineaceae bacterium]
MTRIRKDPKERTAEILQTARNLFDMFGYQHVSMADIGEASALARSSLYEYFASKEDIALALLSDLATPFEATSIHGKKLEKRLTNLIEDSLQVAIERSSLLALFFGAFPSLDEAGRNAAAEWQSAILDALLQIFQDEKKLRFSASKAAYFSLGLVLQRINDMVSSKATINPAEEAEAMAVFIVKGVERS